MKCPRCHDAGWVCEEHQTRPLDHDGCGGAAVPCTCAAGRKIMRRWNEHAAAGIDPADWTFADVRSLDERRAPAEAGNATLWTLTKAGSRMRAVVRKIPGVGVELRFLWDDDTRETTVYRNARELANAAIQKRAELIARGWVDPGSLGSGR